MMKDIRYPGLKVRLVGEDGNALFILGKVRAVMQKAGVPKEDIEEFTEEATAGDYNDLLMTVMDWVDVE